MVWTSVNAYRMFRVSLVMRLSVTYRQKTGRGEADGQRAGRPNRPKAAIEMLGFYLAYNHDH